ncbi:hypothetical protein ACQPYK_05865 [Streptosporangium sp. CA-135522]|uniref:hypothetical protein n=1 Tax=Streptosporangium sp. CA-135522 TaxID=3240072 RepID=UPI003D94E924
MTSPDDLEARLLALGESLDIPAPPPADVARAVRARLESPAADRRSGVRASTPWAPVRRALRRAWRRLRPGSRLRWRAVVSGVAILLALFFGATPAGRAAVAQILRFAGVELRIGDPASPPSGLPEPLPGERRATLEQARAQAAFPISVPAELGAPREVRVSDGGRVVSLLWPGIRLDEYDGTLQVVFRKELGPPWPEEVAVGASPAQWIPARHGLSYLPRGGGGASVRPRSAGPTLIWQRERAGLRLEGVDDLRRALRIARSVR